MKEITTEELLERICHADSEELNKIIPAVERQFRTLWPKWDLLVISCKGRTPEAHVEALQQSIRLISSVIKKELM